MLYYDDSWDDAIAEYDDDSWDDAIEDYYGELDLEEHFDLMTEWE